MTSERRKQRRAASLKRRRHVREPERRFHIYCEGIKTEPAYFKALRSQFSRVQLEVIPVGGDPMHVARKAIEHRRRSRRGRQSSFEETDQVWAVFDRDNHATHATALDACRRAGVHVASSDPCFDYGWRCTSSRTTSPLTAFKSNDGCTNCFPRTTTTRPLARTSATFSRAWKTPRRTPDGNFNSAATKVRRSAIHRRPSFA